MTEAKPATFAKGDKVTSKTGVKLVVIGQASPGSAVHAESPKGDKPYVNTFFAADSLTKGNGRAKPAPAAEPIAYVVTLKKDDGETYTVDLEAKDDDAALEAAASDELNQGDEVVSVDRADA